jgi:hypothetical protein
MHPRAGRRLERALSSWLVAALFLLLGCGLAQAQGVPADVTQMQVERTDDGVYLSATVRFDLPTVVDDALAKGISMYFVAEASIYRDRWYWYDKRLSTVVRHMRVSFQPLTRRWRLQVSANPIGNSGLVLGQMFDSREEALAAIQRFSRWRIADPGEVDPHSTHNVEFRFHLDVSQLPRPFQIGAVGQSEWNIGAVRTQRLQLDAR